MSKIIVLCGGLSREREVSLRSGENVYQALKRLGYQASLLDPAQDFYSELKKISPDLVFVALHGHGGEDGLIQGLLEYNRQKYTGSGVFASALCMNKVYCKMMMERMKVKSPKYVNIGRFLTDEKLKECLALEFPLIIKPISEGSSIGVQIIKRKDHLETFLAEGIQKYGDYFVEECITENIEITVSAIGSGERIKVLPILELVPKCEFYDYQAKYTKGMTEFHIPARLPEQVYNHSFEMALKIYRGIGLRGFARVDMLVKGRDVYVTEINTIPGMTDTSDLPASAKAAGIGFDELVDFIVKDALEYYVEHPLEPRKD
ncbi:MAG: D-alanine--D-alanine ligase [Candidatus Wallbacteria bacterium]|nr:D-alanine--D-alanine ligase [Candidatus Wallbacteria bacterium]